MGTNKNGDKTWDDKWDVPDKTTSQSMPACTVEQQVLQINSAFTYQSTVSNNFDITGFAFLNIFGFSSASKHIRKVTDATESIFAHVQATCSVYKLTMDWYSHPELDPNFVAGVEFLPLEYDQGVYMSFLEEFGTHVATELTLGGRWGWQMEFEMKDYEALLVDSYSSGFNVNAAISDAGKVKANIAHSKDTSFSTRVTSKISKNSSYNTGGTFKPDVKDWTDSVRAEPMPVHMQARDITKLFTPEFFPALDNLSTKKAHMETALSNYCSYLRETTDNSTLCTAPKPIPFPTPPPPIKNGIHSLCVHNSGAYVMKFDMWIDGTSKRLSSDHFSAGKTKCLQAMLLDPKRGDVLKCKAHVTLGKSPDCSGPFYQFDPMAKLVASYKCTGWTLGPHCKFDHLSEISVVDLYASSEEEGNVTLNASNEEEGNVTVHSKATPMAVQPLLTISLFVLVVLLFE